MTIKFAEQKIKEARQRVAALDRSWWTCGSNREGLLRARTRGLRCWRCASSPGGWRMSAAGPTWNC